MIDIARVIWVESHGDADIKPSATGAVGLCQIMPETLADFNAANGKGYTVEMLKDPMVSIEVSDWYLTKEIPRLLASKGMYETTFSILACYNGGFGNYIRYLNGETVNLPRETVRYIEKYYRSMNEDIGKAQEWVMKYRQQVKPRG